MNKLEQGVPFPGNLSGKARAEITSIIKEVDSGKSVMERTTSYNTNSSKISFDTWKGEPLSATVVFDAKSNLNRRTEELVAGKEYTDPNDAREQYRSEMGI